MNLSTNEVRLLVKKRYAPPAWALLEEVRNKTGWATTERYADAVAMSLWPSRGLDIHGIEIKVSRSDWQHELADPTKSAPIQKYCDYWWIVTGNKEIVDVSELPPTWGLMVADKNGTKLITKVQAPRLTSEPLDRAFVASILRRAHELVERATTGHGNEHYHRGFKEGREVEKQSRDYKLQVAQDYLERTLTCLKHFEEVSGVQIGNYDGRNIGEAVRLVLQHRQHGGRQTALKRAISAFETQLESMKVMEQCLDALDQQDLASSDPTLGGVQRP